jgi:hypothetical protein
MSCLLVQPRLVSGVPERIIAMLIIPHIPKTGGMSFRDYLQKVYGTRAYLDYKGLRSASVPLWRKLIGPVLGQPGGIPWGTQCIMGHFNASKFAPFFPEARFGTWVREPVQRVISYYYYLARSPGATSPHGRLLHSQNLSLREFAELPTQQNLQSKMLDCKPLAEFAFVGLTEQFDLGIKLFARIFRLPEPACTPRYNVNPQRTGTSYQIDPEVYEFIRLHNLDDAALYEEGRRCFASLCRTYGLDESALAA